MIIRACDVARILAVMRLAILGTDHARADPAQPFAQGYRLDTDLSDIRVMSVKNSKIGESSGFEALSGTIGGDGMAKIEIHLHSIDTKIDLRNVLMRLSFFETFRYPTATITAVLDPKSLARLAETRHMTLQLDYVLNLHGVSAARQSRVNATLLDNDTVLIASAQPVPIALEDFNLEEGRAMLQDGAQAQILPIGTVSFSLLFRRSKSLAVARQEPSDAPVPEPNNVALETDGAFDREACVGRFEVLSRTGNIYFRPGSTELDPASVPLLETVLDIVTRCPGMRIQIAGHTNSDGPSQSNMRLSEQRARAVGLFLTKRGVPRSRIDIVGLR